MKSTLNGEPRIHGPEPTGPGQSCKNIPIANLISDVQIWKRQDLLIN